MKKLEINLENCFGIGRFKHIFDFGQIPTNTFLLYAPNGTMKTSLAKTLALLSKNDPKQAPCDRVHPERVSKCSVIVDGNQILGESILVVNAEDNSFDASDKISSFIAREELKKQYDKIYQELELKKKEFIKKLKSISKSSDCEAELLSAFQSDSKDTIFEILSNSVPNLLSKPVNYSFKYNDVFDTKGNVKKFLLKNAKLLDQYAEKYTEVLSKSTFFKSSANSFGTYQANEIMKSVEGDSFFHAGHKFTLDGGKSIDSTKGLREIVQLELNRIIDDPQLRQAFDKVDKEIAANVELRAFQKVIEKDNTLLLELKDYEEFKKKVWIDYISQMVEALKELIEFYTAQKPALETILEEARKEVQIWKEIIETFNSRFYVPFVVSLINQEDILLKEEAAALEFTYDDKIDAPKKQDKESLLSILSKGEQRAYYILQFLFEIESRRKLGVDTLLVFDDIADSFDYKNKFAITEYIKDLHLSNGFRTLILTHNFDFYRTIGSRLGLNRSAIFMAVKNSGREVKLLPGQYINNVFIHFLSRFTEQAIFISLLPFVRNLIEYSEDSTCIEYCKLTSCLHIKPDTDSINGSYLLNLYNTKLPKTIGKTITFGNKKIKDLIYETADEIGNQTSPNEVALENKIVLSMAIRLKAEEYMISKVPVHILQNILSHQTKVLYDEFLKTLCTDKDILRTLDRVILMTPENIHINAFMYEPLIDMTILHLTDLYRKVKTLV